jgi:hypothetical protein
LLFFFGGDRTGNAPTSATSLMYSTPGRPLRPPQPKASLRNASKPDWPSGAKIFM